MLVLFHVLTALASLIYSTYLLIWPSRAKLHIAYGLVAMTLASGTCLVWSTHTKVLPACTSGLAYTVGVSVAIIFARRRLASLQT
jgi:hypothetical protein